MVKNGITVEVRGGKEAMAKINKAKTNLKDTKKLFERISIYLERSTAKTFKVGGRPKAWKPSQRAIAESGETLKDNNQLFMSVTGRGKGNVRRTSGTTLVFGTKLVHGAVNQFGNPDRNLPARPFLGIHKEDEKAIEKIMKEWGDKATAEATR